MILVKTYYNTEADGTPVEDDRPLEDMPITYHGPFASISDAVTWMNDVWPDDDTDVYDQVADDFDLPAGTYINDPDTIFGDIPDDDIRELTEEEEHDLGPIS